VHPFALLLSISLSGAAEPKDPVSNSFKYVLVSKLEQTIQEKKQKIEAETEIGYTWKSSDREKTLHWNSVKIKASADGKEVMNSFASAEKWVNIERGEATEVGIDDAPEKLKQMLKDSFTAPLCTIQIDENGKEVKRKLVAGPGAKEWVDNGVFENSLVFHPPFMRDQDKWEAPMAIPTGLAGSIKGDVTYKKLDADKKRVKVSVAGELTADSVDVPGKGFSLNNAKYVIKGEQVFDLTQREWVSGKLTIEVSFELFAGKKQISTATGTIEANMEMLPEKR